MAIQKQVSKAGSLFQMLLIAAITAALAAFIYSGRSATDCAFITVGISSTAAVMYCICRYCRLSGLASMTAATILALCPYMTELASLNPALPLITASAAFAFCIWVAVLCMPGSKLWQSAAAIAAAPVLLVLIFQILASPDIMGLFGLDTVFPMPISERAYLSAASIRPSAYNQGLPVSVGYLTLIIAPIGIYRLGLNGLLTAAAGFLFIIAVLDKPIFQTPPAIWAIFPIISITMMAANATEKIALLIENRFQLRPIWIMIIPVVEVVFITYAMTY
jgi:hypothetical protein